MKNEHHSFVFFGSGPVAAENLRQLTEQFHFEAIITKPSTLDEMSQICGADVPVYPVENKRQLDDLFSAQHFKSPCGILIDFGIIVSNDVIGTFPKGIINSHFSLLPQWRGADPITFSLLSGQKQTGVSLMRVVEKMDEGPLLAVGFYDIQETDTTPILSEKLIALSTALLIKNLPAYMSGDLTPRDQLEVAQSLGLPTEPTYSRKLAKADGKIDWHKPADVLEREVRAFAGWPKSFTTFGNIDVVVTQAHAVPSDFSTNAGEIQIQSEGSKLLMVQCGHGYLCIEKLKPIGKREMDIAAFLAGYKNRL